MAAFWTVLLVLLIAAVVYAAYSDRAARKDGQVLVPVKGGRGRRTKFVRMDRAEVEEAKLAAILAKQQAEREERQRDQGIPTPVSMFSAMLRRRMR